MFLNSILIVLSATATLSSAFFWGSQENSPPYQPQYYHQRLLQGPTTYTVSGTEPPQQIPVAVQSIPVQLPLQAQLAPAATVHNVQLVPCLCPVSQDFEVQDGVYFAANQQQHKN